MEEMEPEQAVRAGEQRGENTKGERTQGQCGEKEEDKERRHR